MLTVALPAVAGHADQPATIDSVQAKIDNLANRAEVLSEKYNAGTIALAAAQKAASEAAQRASAQEGAVRVAREHVAAMAAAAYRSGGDAKLTLLLTSDSDEFIDRAATLGQVGRNQGDQLKALKVAQQKQNAARAAAAQHLNDAQRITAGLARDKTQVTQLMDEQQSVLASLKEEERKRLEAERAAAAAAARAKAEAAMKAAAAKAEADRKAAVARQQAAAASRAAARSTAAAAPAKPAQTAPAPSAGGSSKVQTVIAAAMSKLGVPYVWGGAGPNSFDCSGLTQWAYAKVGISIGHYTGSQWNEGRHVSQSELQPGDLVFFYPDHHHVGIYLGGGMMVHAPQTGDVVKVSPLAGRAYSGAVRLIG